MVNPKPSHTDHDYPQVSSAMLMESLFSHSRRLIADSLLKQKVDLPLVRTKRALRAHTQLQLDEGIIDPNRLIAALIELEGWGRQQIYLFKWTGGKSLRYQWQNHDWVENHIRDLDLHDFFNNPRPFNTQRESSLFTISYPKTSQRIRFVWVQNRTTLDRLEDEDPEPSDFEVSPEKTQWQRKILRAYREIIVRDVTSFEWDIASSDAMLMIRKLKGTKYMAVRDQIKSELTDTVPILDFEPLRMSKLIDNLDSFDDVIRPKLRYRALSDPDTTVTFTRSKRRDVLSNPLVKGMRKESREDVNGYGGFSLWPVKGGKQIGLDLYAIREKDHRIGIRGEQLEKDVRSVLQRIRPYCK